MGEGDLPCCPSLCLAFHVRTCPFRLHDEDADVAAGLVSLKEHVEFESSVQLLVKTESLLISVFIFLLDLRPEDAADSQRVSAQRQEACQDFGAPAPGGS